MKIDDLIGSNQMEEDQNNSLSRMVTYLTSFLLCLEQLCYNENHPEFKGNLEQGEEGSLSKERVE